MVSYMSDRIFDHQLTQFCYSFNTYNVGFSSFKANRNEAICVYIRTHFNTLRSEIKINFFKKKHSANLGGAQNANLDLL